MSKRRTFAKVALQVKAEAESLSAILRDDACEGLHCTSEEVSVLCAVQECFARHKQELEKKNVADHMTATMENENDKKQWNMALTRTMEHDDGKTMEHGNDKNNGL